MKFRSAVLLLLVSVVCVSPVLAAYSAFLDLGPAFKGSASDRDHRDCIEVVSIKGPNKATEAGPLTLQVRVDQSITNLLAAATQGLAYPIGRVDVSQTIGGTARTTLRMTLNKVTVKEVNFLIDKETDANNPMAQVVLSYDTITWEYPDLKPDGSTGGPAVKQGWDNLNKVKI